MYLNNLQSLLFSTILLLFMGFIACEKSGDLYEHAFGKSVNLEINKESKLVNDTDTVKILLKSIDDSRCPPNANCVRAGALVLNIAVSNKQSRELILKYGDLSNFKPDTVNFSLDSKNYRAIFEGVVSPDEINEDQTAAKVYFEIL